MTVIARCLSRVLEDTLLSGDMVLLLVVMLAAAPSKDTLAAIGCSKRKCKVAAHAAGKAGTVLEVVLPDVKTVDGAGCQEPAQEWWLVDTHGTVQRLLSICNNGYGAAGLGEDSVEVKGTTFTHSRNGGSAWRWSHTTEVQLAPLEVVSERTDSMHTSAPNLNSTTSWHWQRFEGRGTSVVAGCNAEGQPDTETEQRFVTVEWAMVPLLTLPSAFRDGGWKATSPGRCRAGAPFTTFGKRSDDKDASLRAVFASPTELYVEVRDDVFVERAATWVLADHLELWTSEAFGSPVESCIGRKGGDQWAVALDGTTTRGFGTQAPAPVIEVARADGVVRFKVLLGTAANSLTLVYSDTDDGKQQKRLVATSSLKYAQPATMGRAFTIAPPRAECVQQGAELVPHALQQFTRDVAVIE